ncbi:hypothetical protein D3C72_1923330 [compost metagenome]
MALEAAEELGQAVVLEADGRIVHGREELVDLALVALIREAFGDERIVMRPDRADVVADGVVDRALGGKRANAPAREHGGAQEGTDHLGDALGGDDVAPERMAGV